MKMPNRLATTLLSHPAISRALLASALLAPLTLASACSDIAKCQRGTQGCWQGPTFDDGSCLYDLVPTSGTCLKPGETLGGGSGGICEDWSDGEQLTPGFQAARCTWSDEWTDEDGTPDELFNLVCQAFCTQDRVHAAVYCGEDSSTIDDFCATPDNDSPNHTVCMQLAQAVAGSATDLPTLTQALELLCREAVATSCEDTVCTSGGDPICSELAADICFDDCAFSDDGFCDDGEVLSSDTSDCAYGHDCTDCGPRTIAASDALEPAPLGASCVTNPGCEGFNSRFTKSDAFCVFATPDVENPRCLASCTGDRTCPDGTECKTVVRTTSSGSTIPLTIFTDEGPAEACFPTTCE
jgi:hypothetical protein